MLRDLGPKSSVTAGHLPARGDVIYPEQTGGSIWVTKPGTTTDKVARPAREQSAMITLANCEFTDLIPLP